LGVIISSLCFFQEWNKFLVNAIMWLFSSP
jgi:hypothetical protein